MKITGIDHWNNHVDMEDAVCNIELTKEDKINLHTLYLHHAHINKAQNHQEWENYNYEDVSVLVWVQRNKRTGALDYNGIAFYPKDFGEFDINAENHLVPITDEFKLECMEFVNKHLQMGR